MKHGDDQILSVGPIAVKQSPAANINFPLARSSMHYDRNILILMSEYIPTTLTGLLFLRAAESRVDR